MNHAPWDQPTNKLFQVRQSVQIPMPIIAQPSIWPKRMSTAPISVMGLFYSYLGKLIRNLFKIKLRNEAQVVGGTIVDFRPHHNAFKTRPLQACLLLCGLVEMC